MTGSPAGPGRALPLQGARNFRDLGGHVGAGGRRLKPGLVFRSDQPGNLTPQDHATVAGLKLARIVDFRGREERARAPYRLDGVEHLHLPIEPTVGHRMDEARAAGRAVSGAEAAALMTGLYASFATDEAPRFAEFLHALLHAPGPLAFHCTAGKDRTGFAAAVLLESLGVSRAQVMQDFLLSNAYVRVPSDPPPEPAWAEAAAVLWAVRPQYLEAAWAAIDARHGGFDAFRRGALGLGDDALAALAGRLLHP